MSNTVASPGGYRERNSTSDRTLTILEMFHETRLVVTANDVADELGVARSTSYRYLQSLAAAGYLEEAPGGGFRLGLKVLELARVARRGYGVADAVRPLMQRLADRFGQTVLLTRRSGAYVVCVERTEARGLRVRLSYERGTQLPINAGSSALILLTGLDESAIREVLAGERLQRFTDNTLVDADAIVERVQLANRRGYLLSEAEVDPDVGAVAVPIRDDLGDTIAGLSIVALRNRVSPERRNEMREALVEVAPKLARILTALDG